MSDIEREQLAYYERLRREAEGRVCSPEQECVDMASSPADLCDYHRTEFRAWQAYHGKTPDPIPSSGRRLTRVEPT